MGYHYDYATILNLADNLKTHPTTGQKLAEHVAHDEQEFPITEEFGLSYAIAMFREVNVQVPSDEGKTHSTNLSEYLCCLDEYHDFLTTQDEEDILHDICLETEMNLKDIEKVRHFWRSKNA